MSSGVLLSRLTRRQWGIFFSSVPLLAQIPSRIPPQGVPAPPAAATTPEQKLQKAYSDIRDVSQRLAQIEVPMDLEPAFLFHV